MFRKGQHCTDFPLEQVVELVLLQQRVADVADAGGGQRHTHVVQVVEVGFQIVNGEVARYRRQVVQHPFPIHPADVGQLEQGGNLRVEFQKSDVGERERGVRHHGLELHTQAFGLVAYLHQVAAPI